MNMRIFYTNGEYEGHKLNLKILVDEHDHAIEIWDNSVKSLVGEIFPSKVIKVLKNTNGAIVEFNNTTGYMKLQANQVVHEGDEISIQVLKDSFYNKPYRVSSRIDENLSNRLESRFIGIEECYQSDDRDLWSMYKVPKMLDEALGKYAKLKSGGSLSIEPTEALTVIDVNSHESNRSYADINIEAAKEIRRQLRLRNISGMIVIDMINMSSDDDRHRVLEALSDYDDYAKVEIIGFTSLGLVEMTRERIYRCLNEQIKMVDT